ncbi:MAG: hypothetical protein KatS3mg051_1195 [Anaerolineae bacterium]|nr:MAG: hypothetical protein KatS3mg051_1195 [Anaerolineae bacterium]
MAGMSQEQRLAALSTIFLSDGAKAMIPLLDAGREGFLQMKEAVNQAGAAARAANARMSGLSGAIEYFRGSMDSALISVASRFLPVLSTLIRSAADLITRFTELPQPIQNAALAFGAVLAAAGPLLLALSGVAAAISFLLSPIGLVVVAVAGLAAAWAANFGGIREKTTEVLSSVQPQLQAMWSWVAVRLPGAFAAMRNVWSSAWGMLPGIVEQAQSRIQQAWGVIVGFLSPALNRLRIGFDTFQSSVGQLAPKFQVLLSALQNLWQATHPILTMLGGLIVGALGVIAVGAINLLASTFSRLVDVAGVVLDQITLVLNSMATIIQETVALITALLRGDWAAAWQSAQTIAIAAANLIWGSIRNNLRAVVIVFGIVSDAIVGTLQSLGVDTDAAMTVIKNAWSSAWISVQSTVMNAINGVTGALWSLQWWLTVTLQAAISGFEKFLSGISLPNPFTIISDTVANIGEAVTRARAYINSLKTWLDTLVIQNPFSNLGIGNLASEFTLKFERPEWLQKLLDWSWPALPKFEWPALPQWRWPDIPVPAWVETLFSGSWWPDVSLPDLNPFNATGAQFFKGGLTWVGERGPELVALPRGSRIFSNRESMEMVGAGGPQVIINATLNNDLDVEELAYRIARVIQRRQR